MSHRTSSVNRHKVRAALKVGTTIYLSLLVAELVTANLPASLWTRIPNAGLYPGFICAFYFMKLFGLQPAAVAFIPVLLLGSLLDIVSYSAVALLVSNVARSEVNAIGAPAAASRSEAVRRGHWPGLLTSIKLGFGMYVLVVVAALVIPWQPLGHWCLAPGDRVFKAIFGLPAHGAGGIYVVLAGSLNVLIYSALMFIALTVSGYAKPATRRS